MVKKEWLEKGFVSEPIDASLNLQTEIRKLCKEKKVYVSLGSDSHGRTGVGDFRYCLELIRECSFPEELIVNTSPSLFSSLLKPHREARKQLVR